MMLLSPWSPEARQRHSVIFRVLQLERADRSKPELLSIGVRSGEFATEVLVLLGFDVAGTFDEA